MPAPQARVQSNCSGRCLLSIRQTRTAKVCGSRPSSCARLCAPDSAPSPHFSRTPRKDMPKAPALTAPRSELYCLVPASSPSGPNSVLPRAKGDRLGAGRQSGIGIACRRWQRLAKRRLGGGASRKALTLAELSPDGNGCLRMSWTAGEGTRTLNNQLGRTPCSQRNDSYIKRLYAFYLRGDRLGACRAAYCSSFQ